jgi:hypothetical protein
MKWIQLIAQLLIQYSVQQKQVTEAPEKIKGMSIQAGIVFLGLCVFGVLSLASTIMIFSDLGKQWENASDTHLSGPIQASLWMFALGTLVFLICIFWARHLSKKQAPEASPPANGPGPLNPLTVFGEEFLGQLITKLSQKP